MPRDAIDDDTLAAIVTLWTGLGSTLPALLKEPVQAGAIKPGLEPPYGQASVEPGGNDILMSQGVHIDKRKVALRVWGTKPQATEALAGMLALFNLWTRLEYPSGARAVRFLPENHGKLSEEKEKREGQDVWLAEVTGEAWSTRQDVRPGSED